MEIKDSPRAFKSQGTPRAKGLGLGVLQKPLPSTAIGTGSPRTHKLETRPISVPTAPSQQTRDHFPRPMASPIQGWN
eukprot:1919509-Rhodomonas_salina.2